MHYGYRTPIHVNRLYEVIVPALKTALVTARRMILISAHIVGMISPA